MARCKKSPNYARLHSWAALAKTNDQPSAVIDTVLNESVRVKWGLPFFAELSIWLEFQQTSRWFANCRDSNWLHFF